jgi:hypothetical protein
MSEELANLAILDELGAQLGAGFRRSEAGRVKRPAKRAAVLALAAAIGAGAVLATQAGDGGTTQAQAAARLLGTVARAAERQQTRLPGPRQFFFVAQRSTVLLPIGARAGLLATRELHGPHARVVIDSWVAWSATRPGAVRTVLASMTFLTAAARERWVALGRPPLYRALVFSTRAQTVAAIGRRIPLAGSRSLTIAELLTLPADPGKLYRTVFRGLPASAAFDAAATLNLYPLRAPVRAALYRALARVRGIVAIGSPGSLAGRTVVALGVPDGGVEDEIILDPSTGAFVGSRTVTRASRADGLALGSVRSQTLIIERAITNRPAPPSGRILDPHGHVIGVIKP